LQELNSYIYLLFSYFTSFVAKYIKNILWAYSFELVTIFN